MKLNGNAVKAQLKKEGIDTRKISIKVEYLGYGSTSIKCVIKDLSVRLSDVETFLKINYQDIRRDENVPGEYFEGCNTYVNCQYDFDIFEDAIENKQIQAEKIYNDLLKQDKSDYSGIIFYENSKIEVIAFLKDKIIRIFNKEKSDLNTYKRLPLNSTYDLAKALVILDIYGDFGLA